MGVAKFQADTSWQSLGLTGEKLIDIEDPQLKPQNQAALIRRPDGSSKSSCAAHRHRSKWTTTATRICSCPEVLLTQ
jgi:hypothetical protein